MPYAFGAVYKTETIVFGASRPGYSSNEVPQEDVDSWIKYMKAQGIQRVICLLPESQLAFYDQLLECYRKAFGLERVCWAPIEDFKLARVELLTKTILPYLKEAEKLQEKVVVHCSGGIGRTGHVLAAWLVYRYKISNEEAKRLVRESGRNAEESEDQGLDALLNASREFGKNNY